jgi:hypothetical protein
MEAQAEHRAPSGRFIRTYLLAWGLLAAGGLAYLASLAWQPELMPASRPQATVPDPAVRIANRALAEVGGVRQTVNEIQEDMGRLKTAMERRESEDKAAQARLAALEDRVTTMAAPVQAAAEPTDPPARLKSIDKARMAAEKRKTDAETQRPASRVITVTDHPKTSAAPAERTDEPKIETGSISPAPTIVFGAPEVTPAQPTFAVQLSAGPSIEALRRTWQELRERHSALDTLQPRFLPPRAEGGRYRLLAGPLPSKAEADKVCAELGTSHKGCFSTAYTGQPL